MAELKIQEQSKLELRPPSRDKGLFEVFKKRYLLSLIVKKNTKTRYRGSFLGLIWTYIKPLWLFFMYYFVMGGIMGRGAAIYDYPIYLLSGLTIARFFTEAFSSITRCITSNSALIKKIYLPRELFAVASIRNSMTHFLPQTIILYLVTTIILFSRDPSNLYIFDIKHILAAIVALAIILTFSLGLGMIFACLNVFYKDSENIVDLITTSIIWVSPVMYEATIISEKIHGIAFDIYMSSPIAAAVELFHYAFNYNSKFDNVTSPQVHFSMNASAFSYELIALFLSIALLFVGQLMFKHFEGKFAKRL